MQVDTTYDDTLRADVHTAADLCGLDDGIFADVDVVADAQRKVGKQAVSGRARTRTPGTSWQAGGAPRRRPRNRSGPLR